MSAAWNRFTISIHALLAESDRKIRYVAPDVSSISIHALLAESDEENPTQKREAKTFLSTLSLRRATDTSSLMQCQAKFLSTLSLRRATASDISPKRNASISIHALLAESDYILVNTFSGIFEFLSTLSLRRATLRVVDGSKSSIISIHALLAESDRPLR